jgi:hypothetical protein
MLRWIFSKADTEDSVDERYPTSLLGVVNPDSRK